METKLGVTSEVSEVSEFGESQKLEKIWVVSNNPVEIFREQS
jgi:hypothetical protein